MERDEHYHETSPIEFLHGVQGAIVRGSIVGGFGALVSQFIDIAKIDTAVNHMFEENVTPIVRDIYFTLYGSSGANPYQLAESFEKNVAPFINNTGDHLANPWVLGILFGYAGLQTGYIHYARERKGIDFSKVGKLLKSSPKEPEETRRMKKERNIEKNEERFQKVKQILEGNKRSKEDYKPEKDVIDLYNRFRQEDYTEKDVEKIREIEGDMKELSLQEDSQESLVRETGKLKLLVDKYKEVGFNVDYRDRIDVLKDLHINRWYDRHPDKLEKWIKQRKPFQSWREYYNKMKNEVLTSLSFREREYFLKNYNNFIKENSVPEEDKKELEYFLDQSKDYYQKKLFSTANERMFLQTLEDQTSQESEMGGYVSQILANFPSANQ